MGKNERFNALMEQRKLKREELIMKRRGLNFITDHHEELLDQSTITVCEQQLDNVAPKVVGLLSLGPTVDLTQMRSHLIKHCLLYQESLKGKNARSEDTLMEEEEAFGT